MRTKAARLLRLAAKLAAHGLALGSYVPEIVGGGLSVALAWWVRDAVEPAPEASS